MNRNGIKYKSQYTFNDLKYKSLLKFDFAIFDNDSIKCLIEYNGEQHYKFKKRFHKNYENFIICQYRDKLKRDYCINNDTQSGLVATRVIFNSDYKQRHFIGV